MLLLEDIKKHIRVTAHYTVHIGIAPSFYIDRIIGSIIIKDMPLCLMQLLHFSPDIHRSPPLLQYQISAFPRIHLHTKMEADGSWRIRIAAPHIPHVPYVFTYSIFKVHMPTCVGKQKAFCLFG